MSHRNLYKCDRCGKEQDNRNFLLSIQLVAGKSTSPDYLSDYRHTADWCTDCAKEFGFTLTGSGEHIAKNQTPTLEDVIRAIMREEIGGAQ